MSDQKIRSSKTPVSGPLFQWKGKPSVGQLLPMGMQHVVAAVVSTVGPALMVSKNCGLDPATTTLLVQMALLMTAFSTILMLFPVTRYIGSGLPVIMGVGFTIPTLMSKTFTLPEILGAQVVAGVVAVLFGLCIKPIRKHFPPLVTGTVILAVGMNLYPVAIKYMAGGAGSEGFSSPKNWGVALVTFALVLVLQNFGKGLWKLGAVLWGLIAGYIMAIVFTELGIAPLVDFSAIGEAGWFSLPRPMQFGIEFNATACISMAILFVANSLQTIGDMSSLTVGGFDRMPTDRELSGGIMAQSVGAIVGAIFGGMPTCSYSECVGIVTVTKVVNKVVFTIAAVALMICGLVPKFASILTTVPDCVLGGAVISVFAIITMTGVRMVTGHGKFTNRKATIVGLSVAVSIGITQVSGCMSGLPAVFDTVFGSFAPVGAALIAIPLNLLLPKSQEDLDDEREQAELERKQMEALQKK